ncbi:MAG: hypothetical protein FJ011_27885 [Chloroflexi bacterium]|nr:hypothetical protein [Chloroflexota bacterium]
MDRFYHLSVTGAHRRSCATASWTVHNHIVCPEMLLWLIEAAGVRRELVAAARVAAAAGGTMMQRAGAIRRHVPWTEVRAALWGER